ncbi:hypothetical protein [Streptomyces echinatus]|uniref:Uncharacterized protein n=1 Tax=Streptomyces echinatus TaxID=67293 RepID=A0A7W9PPC8_9ACTN|nr:hypothetical protein [Streptomyces echinatus]
MAYDDEDRQQFSICFHARIVGGRLRVLRVSPWIKTPGELRPGRRATASLPPSVNGSASTRSIGAPLSFRLIQSRSRGFRAAVTDGTTRTFTWEEGARIEVRNLGGVADAT